MRTYYYLAKPGIIYGNLIYATAGFLLASKGDINFWLLVATLLGTSMGIASACVFNNYIDRDIDQHMERTKKRALVQHTIPVKSALTYATVLGLVGYAILAVYTNWLTVLVGTIGFIVYVFLYTYGKRKTIYSTLIGSISGSAPPVAGYVAVTGSFDGAALLLFLILTFWQMPHFYAIAIYRIKDYKAANLPVLPVVKGIRATKIQIIVYIAAFTVAVVMLSVLGYTGWTYLVVVGAISLAWLRIAYQGLAAKNSEKWARSVFKFSLVVTLAFSFMLSVNAWLP
ncbi:heme o synthase [Candidatus Saccharibacteria bacterium]|nr:heme o synthase [Candidatus Saccharibacteria bacterium]